jgi:glutaredoxin
MEQREALLLGFGVVLLLWLLASVNSVKIYRFHRPSCPWCVKSEPEWNKFKSKCMFKLIKPVDVNIGTADPSSEEMRIYNEQLGAPGVPTVVTNKNGSIQKYEGDRTANAYLHWLKANDAFV